MAILSRIKFVEDLLLKMAWIIENVVSAETEFPRASYPKTIIWIVVGGKRTIEVNGLLHEIHAGDVVVIPPQTPRTLLPCSPHSEPFRYYSIGCDMKVGSLNFVELYNLLPVTKIEDHSAFQELSRMSAILLDQSLDVIKSLHALDQPQLIINKVTTDETSALLFIHALFTAWIARFLAMMRCYMADKPLEIDPRISRLCAYMQLNLNSKLSLPDLAHYLYISESHLRLLFRKTLGISPSEYLRQIRLQHAKDLLVNTTYSLKEIAELSGFRTLNHFSRMFTASESISATEYRKRYYANAQG